jgi:hypothetical protein
MADGATAIPLRPPGVTTYEQQHRRRSIIQEFALNTSAHGIPGIVRSRSVRNRILWSITSLIFTDIMLYFIVRSIRAYYDYPTQTTVSIDTEWPQLFPACTICNASPFRFDLLIGPFMNYKHHHNVTVTNDVESFSSFHVAYIKDFVQDEINRNESLNAFFYPLSSMLFKCVFNDVPCSTADFTRFSSSTYGSCYTFNAKKKNSSDGNIRYGDEGGGFGQLELGLYAHSHQYLPYFSDGKYSIVWLLGDALH